MSKKPDYDRARNALAHKAQSIGIDMQVARNNSAFEPGFHFRVSLEIDGAPLWDGPYFMGSGHATPSGLAPTPEVADVLPSLFLDASCYEAAGDLLEFCADLGFPIDTQEERKNANRAWNGCRRASRYLRMGLTEQDYATFAQLSSMV